MAKYWRTPSGDVDSLYEDLLAQTHLLIAGATGAGKSTVINGMMCNALIRSPESARFILIDPKGTELDEYKCLPHVLQYADSIKDCVNALEYAFSIVKDRMAEMKRHGQRTYSGSDVYVIIDELMIMMTRAKKEALPLMQDILSLARCAKVHLIGCTQSPVTAVLPTVLKCNWDSRLALRTVCAQDSRNIIGVKGCETFPDPRTDHEAWGMYRHGCRMDVYRLRKIEDSERQRLIKHWMKNRKPRFSLFA